MLFKLHTHIFIVGILAFGIMASMVMERAMSIMTLGAFFAFITQQGLVLFFSQDNHTDYSEKTLFYTVLIYISLLAVVLMLISLYYEGDTFMFSKTDAMLYFDACMKKIDMGLIKGFAIMMKNGSFDDWGAVVFDTFVMYIIPSKYFLNTIYTFFGAISAVFLYKIGKNFMPDSYAFLASLGYATSSYMVFFNCTFLKEPLFIFIVISAYYNLYNAISRQSAWSLFCAGFCLLLGVFFRPAVVAFIAMSIFTYYGITEWGKAISLFLIGIVLVILVVSFSFMQSAADAYTAGGDVDAIFANNNSGSYSSTFNYFVSYYSAFFGPFPTLFSKSEEPSRLIFYGAGLMYKLFLIIPFWIGIFYSIKKKNIAMIPLAMFTLLEMASTGYIYASLELRKVLLHIPLTYIIAFYGLFQLFQSVKIPFAVEMSSFLIIVGMLMLWNVR